MAGRTVMRERRERWARLKDDTSFAADCIERVALGESIRALAAENDIPYLAFWRWITNEHGETLAHARKANAAWLAEQNAINADRVDRGELNPKAAATSAKIREWLASKWDRDSYGDASRLDVNMKGTVALHVQAIRQLSQGATYDGELAEPGQDDGQDLSEHPLL